MSNVLSQLKKVFRLVAGLLVGIAGSGAAAGWLFSLFELLHVRMDPTQGPLGLVAWAAMLSTWVAAGFVGQTVAAITSQAPAIIWLVAAIDASILLFAYSVEPHPVFLAGAVMGFLVAFRLKDSDILIIGRVLPSR